MPEFLSLEIFWIRVRQKGGWDKMEQEEKAAGKNIFFSACLLCLLLLEGNLESPLLAWHRHHQMVS